MPAQRPVQRLSLSISDGLALTIACAIASNELTAASNHPDPDRYPCDDCEHRTALARLLDKLAVKLDDIVDATTRISIARHDQSRRAARTPEEETRAAHTPEEEDTSPGQSARRQPAGTPHRLPPRPVTDSHG